MADTTDNDFSDAALALLRANLGYYGSDLDPDVERYLKSLLGYAGRALADAGIYLTYGDVYDDELQAMYAAWVYRKGGEGTAKPPMLQTAIRNRQVAKALLDAQIKEELSI